MLCLSLEGIKACFSTQDAEYFEAKQSRRNGGRSRSTVVAPEVDPEDVFEVRCTSQDNVLQWCSKQ